MLESIHRMIFYVKVSLDSRVHNDSRTHQADHSTGFLRLQQPFASVSARVAQADVDVYLQGAVLPLSLTSISSSQVEASLVLLCSFCRC